MAVQLLTAMSIGVDFDFSSSSLSLHPCSQLVTAAGQAVVKAFHEGLQRRVGRYFVFSRVFQCLAELISVN
jgi:hypothetical protein